MNITRDEAIKKYGEIKDNKWENEGKWMIIYRVPDFIKITNTATSALVSKIYINKDMADALNKAFSNLKDRNLLSELKTFDGCFNIRDVRGVHGRLSWHSYGLAIDFNAKENKLGEEPKLSKEFIQCFKDAGFIWGGDFGRKDGMHFQFGAE